MKHGRGKERTKPKAVVIGGSMGGLFAALVVQRAGGQGGGYECHRGELAGRGGGRRAPCVRLVYAGYGGGGGFATERDLPRGVRAKLCVWFAFSRPPGEKMPGYPLAGAKEEGGVGRPIFNFVGSRPADADHRL